MFVILGISLQIDNACFILDGISHPCAPHVIVRGHLSHWTWTMCFASNKEDEAKKKKEKKNKNINSSFSLFLFKFLVLKVWDFFFHWAWKVDFFVGVCFGSNREDQARRRVPPSLVEAQVRHHRVQKLWAVPGEGLRLAGPREVLALSRSNDYRLAETLGVAFFSVPTISARSTRRSSRSSTRTSLGRPAGFSTTSPHRSPRWRSASGRSRASDRSSMTRGRCPRLETKDG